jgi:hypothetical protein
MRLSFVDENGALCIDTKSGLLHAFSLFLLPSGTALQLQVYFLGFMYAG